jgi:hypothetical protein
MSIITNILLIKFQDLLALLKNVENEIKLCEVNLKDELEKRKKYRVRCLLQIFVGR